MHEGVRSTDPGTCPLCGMQMLPLAKAIRPPTQLHDPDYQMDFTATSDPASSNNDRARTCASSSKNPDNTTPTLALVHSQLLHLIIVSDSLDYFDHVHPILQPDNSSPFSPTLSRSPATTSSTPT